jgi:rhamnosyltransferase subunit B
VNPLLWLAEGMADRGHEPTFVINPHYGPLIEERGYRWIPVGTKEDFLRFARDPRIWSRMHGPGLVMEGMIRTLPAYRQAIEGAKDSFNLIVLSTLALAAAATAEAAKIPRLTLHMQPALFRSVYECPVFMEELAWLTRAPRWIKRLFFALVDVLVWERVRRRLNAFRDGIGLPALQSFFHDALHGAEGVAALFPRWFAAPQPDWPGRVRQFGFPIVSKTRPLSDSLENFLESVSRRWYRLTAQPILISGIFKPGRLRSRASSISDVCLSVLMLPQPCQTTPSTSRTLVSRTYFPAARPLFTTAGSERQPSASQQASRN